MADRNHTLGMLGHCNDHGLGTISCAHGALSSPMVLIKSKGFKQFLCNIYVLTVPYTWDKAFGLSMSGIQWNRTGQSERIHWQNVNKHGETFVNKSEICEWGGIF